MAAARPPAADPLSWPQIARLGLAQMALGSVVVLMTSTLNRVMVVEIGLAASVPGALVALHFAVQLSRARVGFGSDVQARRTPWIVGGMAVLSAGGVGAALATALAATHRAAGLAAAAVAFVAIGLGVSAAGTSLLALLAERTAPARRAGAAALFWVMMIAGLAVTAGTAGSMLDPFSMQRLVGVTVAVSVTACTLTGVAVWGIEGRGRHAVGVSPVPHEAPFWTALRAVGRERATRDFAVFIFVAMLAYSTQDLILEPFAGLVFGLTPGQSTALGGMQHGGVLAGMIGAALLAPRVGTLRGWASVGCVVSAAALVALAASPLSGAVLALRAAVFSLGVANGAFCVGAIGSMMALTATGDGRTGLRMGVFGAAQAIAFGVGGFAGAAASDLARWLFVSPPVAYGAVFVGEAALFVVAARFAARTGVAARSLPLAERHGDPMLAALR
jgi:BCD family chlorophyll transporter-like MFS transporter